MLSVIAHDLKNPVASVAQFSELLATKPELAAEKHIVSSLKESSQAAVALLDNLLYWGRSQAHELVVKPTAFNTEELIEDVRGLFLHMATQKQIKMKTDLTPGLTAFADPALVNIVVRNLVSNAIKFTPREGTVIINSQQERNEVQVSVIDTGVGINPEILDQFKSMGKLGTSSGTESEIGTGLGLQLVRDLVEQNKGALTIESMPEQGSTFTFTLPLAI